MLPQTAPRSLAAKQKSWAGTNQKPKSFPRDGDNLGHCNRYMAGLWSTGCF